MTKNQIEYHKLQETRRANREQETLTEKRDIAARKLGIDTLQETARHNEQVELQARDNLAEQYRNNLAQLAELQRSHLASEGIAQQQANIARAQADVAQQRADIEGIKASEVQRHNLMTEDLNALAAEINRFSAEVGASSRINAAGISAAASQYASDTALMAKQLQVDLDKYGIDTTKSTRMSELAETRRANVARQEEINRANLVSEALKSGTLLDTVRHNMVADIQNRQKIDADVALRGEQNRISMINALTSQKKVDADVSLVPSQKFSNVARGLNALATPLVQGLNTAMKGFSK